MTEPKLKVIAGGKGAEDPQEVLRAFYEQYASSVYGRCLYLLKRREDAEDAMQEVFARALGNLERFRGEASPLTWLMTIATHHCLNEIRGRRAGWRERFRRTEEARPRYHGGPKLMEARDQVHRLLHRFDLETQRAVVHYHVDGMTLEEVGRAIGRSVPTVRKRLARFAAALEEEGAS